MSAIMKKLSRISDAELFALTEAIDAEVEHRSRQEQGQGQKIRRGYERSTYGTYISRGKRKAPRQSSPRERRLAA